MWKRLQFKILTKKLPNALIKDIAEKKVIYGLSSVVAKDANIGSTLTTSSLSKVNWMSHVISPFVLEVLGCTIKHASYLVGVQ